MPGMDSTRLRDNIITDLFPGYSELTPEQQAQVNDTWGKICFRIIEEVRKADLQAQINNTTVDGTANTSTGILTASVTDNTVNVTIN